MATNPSNPRVPSNAVQDIENAIRLAPGFANMHFLAATMWCLTERAERDGAVLQHAHRAIELGFDPQRLKDLPHFQALLGERQMKALSHIVQRKPLLPDPPRFLDPDPTPEELWQE
jgi:hypothetical protein